MVPEGQFGQTIVLILVYIFSNSTFSETKRGPTHEKSHFDDGTIFYVIFTLVRGGIHVVKFTHGILQCKMPCEIYHMYPYIGQIISIYL